MSLNFYYQEEQRVIERGEEDLPILCLCFTFKQIVGLIALIARVGRTMRLELLQNRTQFGALVEDNTKRRYRFDYHGTSNDTKLHIRLI